MYCFPGGGIRNGEDEVTALVREIQEELGVTIQPLRRLWQSTAPWKVDLAWWLAELPCDSLIQPHPGEVESVDWLTVQQVSALRDLLASNREFLDAWHRGEFQVPLG
jgi:8-oxo-dGTP pyrophosphatase MutT (NUDIX family)